MSRLPRKITRKYARSKFNTVGLCLILYALSILFAPMVLRKYLENFHPYVLNTPALYLDVCLLMLFFLTVIPFGVLRRSFDISLNSIFRRSKMSASEIQDETTVFFLVSSLAIFVSTSLAGQLGQSGSLVYNIGAFNMEQYFDSLLYPLIFVLAAPVIEEYAFRGVLQRSLSRFGKYFALIVASLIYALAHNSFTEYIPSFVIAFYLGKISLISGSIRPCIRIHVIFNLILYLLCIVPDRYSLYVVIFLAVLYIIGIVKLLRRKHSTVSFTYKEDYAYIFRIFFLSVPVIISLVLFIAHSVLTVIL